MINGVTVITPIWHWVLQVTGDWAAGTRWNLAWSGFLSAGVLSSTILHNTYHRWKDSKCHECWRHGPYLTADGGFKLCHHHHPDWRGTKPTLEQIWALHHAKAQQQVRQ